MIRYRFVGCFETLLFYSVLLLSRSAEVGESLHIWFGRLRPTSGHGWIGTFMLRTTIGSGRRHLRDRQDTMEGTGDTPGLSGAFALNPNSIICIYWAFTPARSL